MKYNKILTHRCFKIDFDNRKAICLKCKQKYDLKDFVYSLLIFVKK